MEINDIKKIVESQNSNKEIIIRAYDRKGRVTDCSYIVNQVTEEDGKIIVEVA